MPCEPPARPALADGERVNPRLSPTPAVAGLALPGPSLSLRPRRRQQARAPELARIFVSPCSSSSSVSRLLARWVGTDRAQVLRQLAGQVVLSEADRGFTFGFNGGPQLVSSRPRELIEKRWMPMILRSRPSAMEWSAR
jgi:hypothetical protein